MSFEEKIDFLLSELARCPNEAAELDYIFALIFNAELFEEIRDYNNAGRHISEFVVEYINELIDNSYDLRPN